MMIAQPQTLLMLMIHCVQFNYSNGVFSFQASSDTGSKRPFASGSNFWLTNLLSLRCHDQSLWSGRPPVNPDGIPVENVSFHPSTEIGSKRGLASGSKRIG